MHRLKEQQAAENLRAVENFIRNNCEEISAYPRYRNKLAQSIEDCLPRLAKLADQIPGPIDLDPKHWFDEPLINSVFLNSKDVAGILKSSSDLKRYFAKTEAHAAFCLMCAELHEKTVFTNEKTGDMFRRDVPHQAVYFDDVKITAVAKDIDDLLHSITQLALTSLCRQTFSDTTDLKSWLKELNAQKDLLEFKINTAESGEEMDEVTTLLADIKRKISTVNKQVQVSEEHLERLLQVFEYPENTLAVRTVSLKLDRLGIRLDATSTERGNEFSFAEVQVGDGPKTAVVFVRVRREVMG